MLKTADAGVVQNYHLSFCPLIFSGLLQFVTDLMLKTSQDWFALIHVDHITFQGASCPRASLQVQE